MSEVVVLKFPSGLAIPQLLDRLLAGGTSLLDREVEHDFRLIGTRTVLLNARRISGTDNAGLILLAFEDITERKRASEARYRRLFESARDGIIIIDAATGEIADLNPYTEQLLVSCGKTSTKNCRCSWNPLVNSVLPG